MPQTSGSILSPGEVSDLVGIKPTVGLTSRALVIPISQRQDTVGPVSYSSELLWRPESVSRALDMSSGHLLERHASCACFKSIG
jgi:Asp-tRNA(Asn)/Glu-tRNA(Gln) amidotransferase A subunit family amidase